MLLRHDSDLVAVGADAMTLAGGIAGRGASQAGGIAGRAVAGGAIS